MRSNLFLSLLVSVGVLLAVPVEMGASAGAEPVPVSGRIVDCLGGMEGVRVELVTGPSAPERGVRATRSDGEGLFTLQAPAPGVWTVRVRTEDGLRLERRVAAFGPTGLPPFALPGSRCGSGIPAGWHPASGPGPEAGPPAPLVGEVFTAGPDGRKQPVEGAWLWTPEPAVPIVRTGVDGTYRIRLPPDVLFRLRADAPGFLPWTVAVRAQEGQAVGAPLFGLNPAGEIRGRVVTAGNRTPLPVVLVERVRVDRETAARLGDHGQVGPTFTDATGAFHLRAAPDTTYRLTVAAEGFLPASLEVRSSHAGEPAEPVEIRVVAAAAVTGILLDDTGRPVEGGRVTLVPSGREDRLSGLLAGRASAGRDLPAAESTIDGTFRVSPVPPGAYTVAVRAEGFETIEVPGVEVPADPPTRELGPVFLTPGVRLEGVIEDRSGHPVPGARLGVAVLSADGRSSTGLAGSATVTDGEGRFEIEGLPRGRKVELRAQAQGFLPRVETTVPEEGAPPLRIVLDLAGVVTGQVRDTAGRPVAGARVRVAPEGAEGSLLRRLGTRGGADTSSRTDADGHFHVEGVEPGPAEIHASADCCRPAFRRIQVEPGDSDPVDLELPAGTTLHGLVLDAGGSPVALAQVSSRGSSARTGPDGGFRLQGLADGPVHLVVRHPDHGSLRRTAATDRRQPLEIRFAQPALLQARVVDEEERPVQEARIFLEGDAPLLGGPLESGADGNVQAIVQPGAWELRVTAKGHLSATTGPLAVQAGDRIHRTVVLRGGAEAYGRILGVEPRELVGAQVRATGPAGVAEGRLEENAGYRVSGLLPGPWQVVLQLADGRRGEAVVEIGDGQRRAQADLELGRGRELEGTVMVDSHPLSRAWITVSSFDGAVLARTQADGEGRFRIPGLAADRIHLDVASPSGDLRTARTVDLRSSSEVEIRLWTGSLTGEVRDATTGASVAGATVRVDPLGDSSLLPRAAHTRPDGRFALRLPEGRYRVTVHAPGFPAVVHEIALPRDGELHLDLPLVPGEPDG